MADLTRQLAAATDKERRVEMGETGSLRLTRSGANLGDEIPDGWNLETVDFRATGGKKFYKLTVYDVEKDRAQRLAVMDGAIVNGRPYKVTDKDAPTGETREWIIELQPTGESPAPAP